MRVPGTTAREEPSVCSYSNEDPAQMWLRVSLSAYRWPLGVWEKDCRFFLEEEWNSDPGPTSPWLTMELWVSNSAFLFLPLQNEQYRLLVNSVR